MARKSSHYEFSIPGDELEHHRIQLEHNLQNTDLSLHLSSVPDSQDGDSESAVEYPRHNSVPEQFPAFASFEQSRENFDLDGHSHLHAWSIHDDEGINPYDGQTMSTVAHHASAVTISAGLGRGGRREPSISGAEYDPERPLQDIMAGMESKLSIGDVYGHSRSRHTMTSRQHVTPGDYDLSAHESLPADAVSMAARLRSPQNAREPSDSEETDRSQDISRPKLSETLQRVGFSPRRPRSVQSRMSHQLSHGTPEASHRQVDVSISRRSITPKARRPSAVSFDTTATPIRRHVSQPAVVHPHVNVQPPTPSTSGSRFTKMARGLARDVRQAHDQWQVDDTAEDPVPPASTSAHRSMAKDVTNRTVADMTGEINHASRASRKSSRGRVHLPDVTGLTNAVVSPAKGNLDRYAVRGPGSKEVEVRLIASLNTLHTRLTHLETENSIARRRVRELEYELEQCKRDVVRERTRIMESQDAIDIGAARIAGPSTSRAKGKEKKMNKEGDPNASKYFEIVEEKKALEALITTLRTHLTRVTSDLSSQQQLLEDLRRLRESDALSLSEKTQEINQLRTEVERLAGEIEVLRGVVEEGLNERRQAREEEEEETERLPRAAAVDPESSADDIVPEKSASTYINRPPTPALSLRRSAPSTPARSNHSRAASPSTVHSPAPSGRRFINREELDRISADLDERRSERSSNASCSSAQTSHDPLPRADDGSDAEEERSSVVQSMQLQYGEDAPEARPPSPAPSSVKSRAPSRSHARLQDGKGKAEGAPPFPRINSERMERLFFSAPRHNTNACRMCKGRRSHCHADAPREEGGRRRARVVAHGEHQDDEGFDEGANPRPASAMAREDDEGIEEASVVEDVIERMDRNGGTLKPGDVPPQTVLARVIRELEDEFTHYKQIYSDLAEEYKSMDCATQAAKRHMVADHLRDVIDVLERKVGVASFSTMASHGSVPSRVIRYRHYMTC
ncbi:hypothetical protein HYDPIDRAFT_117349 [Hydnomerulius pinastri MD-312]|uniref:Cep57 centrosome microtubule-binding domain-containing protein n=1 Tax=Hydnomerulius pinastri MD-312 TaxID=994086 RepID=A0A0C9W2Q3_9AGAM|nr:hypothetical protein HYDPIDRAFT_117349 [Hydnomerulius pinastri MD-312]